MSQYWQPQQNRVAASQRLSVLLPQRLTLGNHERYNRETSVGLLKSYVFKCVAILF